MDEQHGCILGEQHGFLMDLGILPVVCTFARFVNHVLCANLVALLRCMECMHRRINILLFNQN